jgi:hypothetical protein
MKNILLIALVLTLFSNLCSFAQDVKNESFSPLTNGKVPQTLEELWLYNSAYFE